MSFNLLCRGVWGIGAGLAGAAIKGFFFAGPAGAATGTAVAGVAGASGLVAGVASGSYCDSIAHDTYMRGHCPKLVEGHQETFGGIPHQFGILPQEAYAREQACAPYLPGGAKYYDGTWVSGQEQNNQQTLPSPGAG
jgi:hypothetical protein